MRSFNGKFTIISLSLLLPVYLSAQEVSQSSSQPEGQQKAADQTTMISVQSLIDSKVMDQDNKEMGTVKNLMLDMRTGKLVRADIALGGRGFLGIKSGEQRISVPWDQVSVKRHEGSLVVVMNQDAVETIRTDKAKQAAGRTNQQQERSSAAKSTPTPATQPPASQSKQRATASGQNQQVTASTDEIRKAEEALQAKGLNPGPIDGKIDSQTQEALREFQKQNNLPVTGSLDQQTAEKLGVKLGGGNGSSPQQQSGKETAPPENKTEASQTK